jgi:hypothetical protein
MAAANAWSDHIAFRNFALALRGSANTWLESQVTLEDITGDRQAWTIIWPLFKAEFATESDDKLILDGLAHLAMKKVENVRFYFGHLNKTNTIIMDAYATSEIDQAEPQQDQANRVNLQEMRAYVHKWGMTSRLNRYRLAKANGQGRRAPSLGT